MQHRLFSSASPFTEADTGGALAPEASGLFADADLDPGTPDTAQPSGASPFTMADAPEVVQAPPHTGNTPFYDSGLNGSSEATPFADQDSGTPEEVHLAEQFGGDLPSGPLHVSQTAPGYDIPSFLNSADRNSAKKPDGTQKNFLPGQLGAPGGLGQYTASIQPLTPQLEPAGPVDGYDPFTGLPVSAPSSQSALPVAQTSPVPPEPPAAPAAAEVPSEPSVDQNAPFASAEAPAPDAPATAGPAPQQSTPTSSAPTPETEQVHGPADSPMADAPAHTDQKTPSADILLSLLNYGPHSLSWDSRQYASVDRVSADIFNRLSRHHETRQNTLKSDMMQHLSHVASTMGMTTNHVGWAWAEPKMHALLEANGYSFEMVHNLLAAAAKAASAGALHIMVHLAENPGELPTTQSHPGLVEFDHADPEFRLAQAYPALSVVDGKALAGFMVYGFLHVPLHLVHNWDLRNIRQALDGQYTLDKFLGSEEFADMSAALQSGNMLSLKKISFDTGTSATALTCISVAQALNPNLESYKQLALTALTHFIPQPSLLGEYQVDPAKLGTAVDTLQKRSKLPAAPAEAAPAAMPAGGKITPINNLDEYIADPQLRDSLNRAIEYQLRDGELKDGNGTPGPSTPPTDGNVPGGAASPGGLPGGAGAQTGISPGGDPGGGGSGAASGPSNAAAPNGVKPIDDIARNKSGPNLEWWHNLSHERQMTYLQKHPESMYAKL